jgi:hypothetical protein
MTVTAATLLPDLSLASWQLPANPIESTFATLRLRQRATKVPGSRAAGVAMPSGSSSPHRPGGAL